MASTTLPEIYRPMMEGVTVKADRCLVCRRTWPLNDHHVVWRSWGEVIDERGNRAKKPTLTLCGFGNNLRDADGRMYCHGKAHHRLLHFRWVPAIPYGSEQVRRAYPAKTGGHWEYLETDEPTKYQDALALDGWRPL